ncbi:MAG: glycosyltransferase [Gemmatimonadaceae bacterium]|nr:glycosyltransferase [Gemmatimonadaceae bacterium]
MKITVICPDVSDNSLGRALLLADMLGRHHEVELVGTMLGAGVWPPGRDRTFHTMAKGMRWPLYAGAAAKLLRGIRGDVVYAIKPLPTSFGIALVHRARTGTPVVLDIDDDELAFRPAAPITNVRQMVSSLAAPNGRTWTRMTVARARAANAVTVASTGLQAHFGGTIIPHAKDTTHLGPLVAGDAGVRSAAAGGGDRLVMFVGTPRPFKGIEDVAAAMPLLRHQARLVVAGADSRDPYVRQLQRDVPDATFLPPFAPDRLPPMLAAADVLVVPQRRDPRTAMQLPSKLLDAMAAGRPVVATAVADIPHILGEGRGIVVPPGDVPSIARAIDTVLGDPAAAAAMGQRARAWCVAHASFDIVAPRLAAVFDAVALERGTGEPRHPVPV